MSEFRTPHVGENIAQAIQDALDPAKPNTMGSAINLINENARAVEDAINAGGVATGAFLADSFTQAETVVGTKTWVIPQRSTLFLGYLEATGVDVPDAGFLYMKVDNRLYRTWGDAAEDVTVTAGIGVITQDADVSLDIEVWWEGGGGTATILLQGIGTYS